MSFASDTGYIPSSIEELMDVVMEGINTQFATSYTTDTFLGTNFYKYFYSLIQQLQLNEVKTSEIFANLQEYFNTTNALLQRPQTTAPGIIDVMAAAGYSASVKAPEVGDAGKAFICVNVDSGADDYAEQKLTICNIIKDCIVAGVITQGDQTESITLSNNQAFDFKFSLPDEIPVLLKLTVTTSENNLYSIDTPAVIKQRLFDNITARYGFGKNFEPQRYFSVVDAPWAESVLLEWSDDDGGNWSDDVFESDFDEIYTFELADITLVEA